MPLDKSLKLLADRSRLAYIPLDRYEMDMDLARTAPRQFCQRWCVLPFDRMSKTVHGGHGQSLQQTSRRLTWRKRSNTGCSGIWPRPPT